MSSMKVNEICKENVDFPTVRVVLPTEDPSVGKGMLCVQWFGELNQHHLPRAVIPKGSQFLFSIFADPKSVHFHGRPESFRVVFLDQIKNWPEPRTLEAMIEGPGGGNHDKWMVWVISSHVTIEYPNGNTGPASPIIEVALIGDPNYGVVAPKRYLNMSVRDEELAKAESL